MSAEGILNFTWLCCSVVPVLLYCVRRSGSARISAGVSVFALLAVISFPVISCSDDLVLCADVPESQRLVQSRSVEDNLRHGSKLSHQFDLHALLYSLFDVASLQWLGFITQASQAPLDSRSTIAGAGRSPPGNPL
jgi:hypothetical protein